MYEAFPRSVSTLWPREKHILADILQIFEDAANSTDLGLMIIISYLNTFRKTRFGNVLNFKSKRKPIINLKITNN